MSLAEIPRLGLPSLERSGRVVLMNTTTKTTTETDYTPHDDYCGHRGVIPCERGACELYPCGHDRAEWGAPCDFCYDDHCQECHGWDTGRTDGMSVCETCKPTDDDEDDDGYEPCPGCDGPHDDIYRLVCDDCEQVARLAYAKRFGLRPAGVGVNNAGGRVTKHMNNRVDHGMPEVFAHVIANLLESGRMYQ